MTKSLKYKHRFIVQGGKLKLSSLDNYQKDLLKFEGKKGILTLTEETNEIELGQYAYYFGVVVAQALNSEDFGGWTKDEFNSYYEDKFLSEIKEKKIGDKQTTIKITEQIENLGSRRMSSFIEWVKDDLAINHDIEIKDKKNYE